jgi:serpin B
MLPGPSRHPAIPAPTAARLLALLALATIFGCAPASDDARASADGDSAAVAALAHPVNAFACDLYRELKREAGNLTFSPLSISAAMGMAYAGAAESTKAEMRQVLHLPAEDAAAFKGYRSLFAGLDASAKSGGSRWVVANALWAQKGMALRPEFARTARESFGAEAGELDFRAAPEPARATMNQWVEKKTEKRIQDLFPQGSIDGQTRLVIANAVYFKGRWEEPFAKEHTRPETFHLGAGAETQAPTMFVSERFRLARIAEARVLELPYKGGQLSMLVLLPDSVEGLASLENRLDADSLLTWTSAMDERKVEVHLPRFTSTREFSLARTLAVLGMPSAFDARTADFSGIDGARDLHISLVAHKAFVDVNEEGTEAAAATGVVTTVTSITMPERFRVDRPFLYLIRDRASGCILFLGRVTDPTR